MSMHMTAHALSGSGASAETAEAPKLAADHFIQLGDMEVAGRHLIIDLLGARHVDDQNRIRDAILRCVDACGATLLHVHLHVFSPNGGVSGVAVLAESHISTHTWPERDYAAFDVFMSGDAQPHRAVNILRDAFEAREVRVQEVLRGEGA